MTSSQSKAIGPQGVAMLNMDGTRLRLEATEADTQVLLLSGEPIDEPIAARGPFVMNTYVQGPCTMFKLQCYLQQRFLISAVARVFPAPVKRRTLNELETS